MRLIVNADDFGLSPAVNQAVRRAHCDGVLTSASLLVNAPAFRQAVDIASECGALGVGIHLNIVRGRPLSPPASVPTLVDADGGLRPFRWRAHNAAFLGDAEREYRAQIETAVAAGVAPTHIDFEKHHAWRRELYELACRVAADYGIGAVRNLREPVAWSLCAFGWPGRRRAVLSTLQRGAVALLGGSAAPLATPDRLLGGVKIGDMDTGAWLRLLAAAPDGTSEVMVHPSTAGAGDGRQDGGMGGTWLGSGEDEFAALVSPRVREAAARAGVEFITYRDLARQ